MTARRTTGCTPTVACPVAPFKPVTTSVARPTFAVDVTTPVCDTVATVASFVLHVSGKPVTGCSCASNTCAVNWNDADGASVAGCGEMLMEAAVAPGPA